MTALEVISPGPLALVTDLGRPGLAHLGVTGSGAFDRAAHALANRLVANATGAATVEVTLGGFHARVRGGAVDIAVTGADCHPCADGTPFGLGGVHRLREGQLLTLGAPAAGMRGYLAVRGGIEVEPVLGSRSHDTLSGLGPPPLRAGDLLPVGRPGGEFPAVDLAPVGPVAAGPVTVRVLFGPRDDWFADPRALLRTQWHVSDRSDRVGLRLTGEPLAARWPGRQLPSEGMVRGAVQVPPDGRPVILGPDHPVTGGYPVIAVVADADTDALAQLRPGQPLRLVELTG